MNRTQKHTRAFKTDIKTREENKNLEIAGYFAIFDSETELFPGAFEKLSRSAFDNQLDADVRALINHDTTLVLGRTKSNTLKLEVDERGLYGTIQINPNDTDALNIYERVKRGDVDQCSFGFYIREEETEFDEAGNTHWTIKDLDLYEVSVCTFPAYQDTGVEAREKQFKDLEERKLKNIKMKLKERLQDVKSNNAE